MKEINHKRRSLSAIIWLIVGGMAAAVAVGCILYATFGGSRDTSDGSDCPDTISGIAVHTDYISEGSVARPGRTRDIHYIVIHETDNPSASATARAHNEYIHDNSWQEMTSWHYTVDDTEIWHHLPDREVAYHAGDSSWREGGNRNGIGIELCVNQGGDFEQTMKNAAQITAYLLLKYDLSLDAVQKHQDFSGKICPSTIIAQNRWDEFLQLVTDAFDEQSSETAQSSE